MAALPARSTLDGSAIPTTSTMKTAMGNLRDFLAGLLGTDGTVAAAKTALGLTIGADVQAYDANIVKKNVANTFTATQVPDNGTGTITSSATYTFDGADQVREITLTNAETVTFGAPTGITEHAMYVLKLKAGDTAARTYAWNAAFKFPGAVSPLLTATATSGAKDTITFIGGPSNTLEYVGHQAGVR